MKSIDKRSKERLSQATQSLTELREQANYIIDSCNIKLHELSEAIEDARNEAYGVLDDLCSEAQSYYDSRSEAWRDNDRGENYLNWINDLNETLGTLDGPLTITASSEDLDDMDFLIAALNENVPESPSE